MVLLCLTSLHETLKTVSLGALGGTLNGDPCSLLGAFTGLLLRSILGSPYYGNLTYWVAVMELKLSYHNGYIYIYIHICM